MVLLYAFFVHTRILDLLVPGFRLPVVLAAGALGIALLSGTIVRAFTSRVGFCLLLLTGWFIFCIPFGSYPSGSLRILLEAWLKNWGLFIMIVALVNTRRQVARMLAVLALGSTVAAVSSAFTGFDHQGRLALIGSSLDDPNTLGMTFLLGLPLWMTVIGDRLRNPMVRMVVVVFTIPILVAMPLTGSRGTLVAALICVTYLFKRFSIGGKTALIVLVSLVVILAGTYLADDLMERYLTVADPDRLETTAASESRVYLLQQGMILVAQNPITGVGLGMFAVAENDLSIEQGLARGTWHTCHNMFMEVLSEGGIPAFIVYMIILWTVWKTLTKIERLGPEEHPQYRQVARQAFWMKITFLAFCACGLFLSTGLTNTFVTFIGIPMAFARIVGAEMDEFARESEEPEDEPVPALPRLAPTTPVRSLRGSA